jgi:hypothetical protein
LRERVGESRGPLTASCPLMLAWYFGTDEIGIMYVKTVWAYTVAKLRL